MTVDVFPGLRSIERELSWSNSDDWAVLIVHSLRFQWNSALQKTDYRWYWRYCVEFWPRKFCERMIVKSIYNQIKKISHREYCRNSDRWKYQTTHFCLWLFRYLRIIQN